MKNIEEVEKLEIMLIKMMENQALNTDDYDLLAKYIIKVKNDLECL